VQNFTFFSSTGPGQTGVGALSNTGR